MHPAVQVTAGCIFLVLIQLLQGGALWALGLAVCIFSALYCAAQWWRIVRRLRFVFLALFVIFMWQTPGLMLIPSWAVWSPTYDGFFAAAIQALRVLAATAVIAVLVHRLGREGWVVALYSLLQPSRVLGTSPERFAVRLYLVLTLLDQASPRQHWLDYLRQGASDALDDAPLECTWQPWLMAQRDKICVAVLLIFLGAVLCLV